MTSIPIVTYSLVTPLGRSGLFEDIEHHTSLGIS